MLLRLSQQPERLWGVFLFYDLHPFETTEKFEYKAHRKSIFINPRNLHNPRQNPLFVKP